MHDDPDRQRRWRRATSAGARFALVAAIAGAVYVSTLPLGRAGSGSPISSSAFYPIGSAGDPIQIGGPAPEFRTADGTTDLLLDLDDRPIHLADFAGRPLWIVFWATWCVPCQQEAPRILAAFHAHRDQNLAVLAIDLQEPRASVAAYAQAHDLDYSIGLDPTAAVRDLYRAAGLPSHFFVDRGGVVQAHYAGEMTAQLIEQHLALITGG